MSTGTAFSNVHINHHLSAQSTVIGTSQHRLRIDSIDGIDITGSLAVDDLKVRGTLTTVHSKDVNLGDAHLRLNTFNVANDDQAAGLVCNTRALQPKPYIATAYNVQNHNNSFMLTQDPKLQQDPNLHYGDIVQVLKCQNSNYDPSDTVSGLFRVHSIETNPPKINVKGVEKTTAAFYSTPHQTDVEKGEWHLFPVAISHISMYGGQVSYCHGTNDDHFHTGKYQSMLNNVHSVGDIMSNDDIPHSHINRIMGGNKVELPKTAVDGTFMKFINMTNNNVDIVYHDPHMNFHLLPNQWTTFTFVVKPDPTASTINGQWYNML